MTLRTALCYDFTNMTSIGMYVFNGCKGVTEITIPDNVTSIGNYAFYSCRNLTEITIPGSVTSIGDEAFGRIENLTVHAEEGTYAYTWALENGFI